jgi:hypothetical protein
MLFRHTEFVPVHVVCVTQLPVPSHVWMELPRQRVSLGAQKPWHDPAMQVWEEQALPLVGVPLALQLQGVLLLQPTWPGAQVPVHEPLMQVMLEQPTGEVNPPSAPHVSMPLFWHSTWLGAQTPVHLPVDCSQVWLLHAVGVPHCPLLPQACVLLPEHPNVPGVHEPLHCAPVTPASPASRSPAPASGTTQMPWHGDAVPHVPMEVQVETALPWHWVWLGAHEPVHDPPTHAWFEHGTGVPQVPASPHVMTPLFEHSVAPGAHWTQAPFQHTAVAPEHVVWFCQWPEPSHVCVTLPMHCVWPCAQTPVQELPTQVWFTQQTAPHITPASQPEEASPGPTAESPVALSTVPSLPVPVSTAA